MEYPKKCNYTIEVKCSRGWMEEQKGIHIRQFLLHMTFANHWIHKTVSLAAGPMLHDYFTKQRILKKPCIRIFSARILAKTEWHISPQSSRNIISDFREIRRYFGFVHCQVSCLNQCLFFVLLSHTNEKFPFARPILSAENSIEACIPTLTKRDVWKAWD